jgi:cyclase
VNRGPRFASVVCSAVIAATMATTNVAAQSRRTVRQPAAAPQTDVVRVLQVRANIYMLSGSGANITMQTGRHGVLLVDTPLPNLATATFAAIATVTPAPIRYVIDTSAARDHIAGNEAVALGRAVSRDASALNSANTTVSLGTAQGMTILAHENVLNELTRGAAVSRDALPTSEYFEPTKDFSFNGEPIIVYHMPNAHSDGDSIVLFRNSDVISTGDVFTPDRYPLIDRTHGGSVQGVLAALNTILSMTVPEAFAEGGTKVIPGHGRLCEETDVAEYRDMVYIVTDRIRDMIAKGRTLAEVQVARPTLDYDSEYRSPAVTPAMFVEAAYSSLVDAKVAKE